MTSPFTTALHLSQLTDDNLNHDTTPLCTKEECDEFLKKGKFIPKECHGYLREVFKEENGREIESRAFQGLPGRLKTLLSFPAFVHPSVLLLN